MDIDQYQIKALETDQFKSVDQEDGKALSIPILGVVGQLGSLISCFKKRMRDGDAYEGFEAHLKEELGDILWYVANIASKWNMKLSDVAYENLRKTNDRFSDPINNLQQSFFYDEGYGESERLPRNLTVQFNQGGEYVANVCIISDGKQIGETLTDNAYDDDGYRFHDVFHMAFAAILGWSPVMRHLMRLKRASNTEVDMVEDGARSRLTEELISVYVFNYAKSHRYLEGVTEIDLEVLTTIRNLVRGLEVENRTRADWKIAILKGYEMYRLLKQNRGGVVELDMNLRTISYKSVPV